MDSKAFFKIEYGLYVLTARENDKDNGCIVNTLIQVTAVPNRISVTVCKENYTCGMIQRTGVFNVSAITTQAEFSLFQRFGMQSGRDTDKFEGFAHIRRAENGLYYLTEQANMYLSARVTESHDLGSHILFLGELTDAVVLNQEESCTYAHYQNHIKPKPKKVEGTRWVCSICGYVYEGDEIPDDFLCPLCSHGKEYFERVDGQPVPAAAVSPAAQAAPASPAGRKFVCMICGYVHEGDAPPEFCPICKAPAAKFQEQAAERTWAAEHVVGIAQGVDPEIIEGLRENFQGECSEVGMYLAMARVAHREGYPEIGLYWEKAAYEEAEHAAKFAELLGEVVTNSTKKNLEMRVDAENGATLGKFELAKRAKELNLDAIHDTVHEMARDEARHGKAFEGLLQRYFG